MSNYRIGDKPISGKFIVSETGCRSRLQFCVKLNKIKDVEINGFTGSCTRSFRFVKYDVVIHSKPNRRLDLRNFEYYYVLLQSQCFSVINARFDKLKKMWPFRTDDDQSPLTFISPRDRLKIKMLFNRHRSFHYKDKKVEWKSPYRERWFYIETGPRPACVHYQKSSS